MKKLERSEMKNLKGGDAAPPPGGGGWCINDLDCHPLTYQCPSGGIYTTGQGDCRYNTFPPHCVYGFVCAD